MPAELDRILMRCLEKDRARRFQSAQDLAFALASIATGPVAVRAVAPASRASVAVLPFLNLSADPDNEFFADGITEDVIAHLSKVRSIKVISRTSVMKFKKRDQSLREIGEQLGAATLLEGSVRRAGNRVRIVAQLIDRDSDEHVWAETYDRDLTDIFAIQTDVALQIAGALRAELSADERNRIRRQPTHDIHAYELYLHGRHQLIQYTAESYVESVRFFEQAIAQDPGFALAYADMAIAYSEMGSEAVGSLLPMEGYALAREAAQKALAIDDKLGEAHGAMGLILFTADFDWKGAERELLRALELNPGDTHAHDHYGWWCSAQCRFDESLRSVPARARARSAGASDGCRDRAAARRPLRRSPRRGPAHCRSASDGSALARVARLGADQSRAFRGRRRGARARCRAGAGTHDLSRTARSGVCHDGRDGESPRDPSAAQRPRDARACPALSLRLHPHGSGRAGCRRSTGWSAATKSAPAASTA